MSKILKESEILAGKENAVPLVCKTCKFSVRYSVSYSPNLPVLFLRCDRCGAEVAIFNGVRIK